MTLFDDDLKLHHMRCNNKCMRQGCYFHPKMGTKERGLDIEHVVPIPTFINRFGCASYTGFPDRTPVTDAIMIMAQNNDLHGIESMLKSVTVHTHFNTVQCILNYVLDKRDNSVTYQDDVAYNNIKEYLENLLKSRDEVLLNGL